MIYWGLGNVVRVVTRLGAGSPR